MRPYCLRLSAWAGLAVGLAGCVEPYVPAVVDAPTSALVVDGFINGNGRSTFLLSHATSISASTLPVEKGAKLVILDNVGGRFSLTEKASGTYQSDSLLLSPARQYQLRITTAANVVYESDLVPLKITPAIDNLKVKADGTQVQVQVSTRDPSGTSRYYRWKFVETWEFNSAYNSELEYDPKQKLIVTRARNRSIYTCWRTERPSYIRQRSTAQLSQDALIDEPILFLSGRSERLHIRYSVLVSQYAETPEEFAYLDLLRKNTEAVGTINDPLPVQLTGNVHRVGNAAEPVLGFVGAHTVQSKRLFIARQDLPAETTAQFDSPYAECTIGAEYLCDPLSGACIDYPKTLLYQDPGTVPIAVVEDPTTHVSPGGYSGSSVACVDCRTRGSITKPSFW